MNSHVNFETLLNISFSHADRGEYSKAVTVLDEALKISQNDSSEYEVLRERWLKAIHRTDLPKGYSTYARAKRVYLVDGDIDRAAQLYMKAIEENDRFESAVKDYAHLLISSGYYQNALELLDCYHDTLPLGAGDYIRLHCYQKLSQFDNANRLLREMIKHNQDSSRKLFLLQTLGGNLMKQKLYDQATLIYEEVFTLQKNNQAIRRNLATCYMSTERYEEAKKLLDDLITIYSDNKAKSLLNKMNSSESWLPSSTIEFPLLHPRFSESALIEFYLNRDDDVVADMSQIHSTPPAGKPADQVRHYFNAARIYKESAEEMFSEAYMETLYKGLYAQGNFMLATGQYEVALDVYLEAMITLESYRPLTTNDQDANKLLIGILLAMSRHRPLDPPPLEQILQVLLEQRSSLEYLAYVISYSNYSFNTLVTAFYKSDEWRALTVRYFSQRGITISAVWDLEHYKRAWLQHPIMEFNSEIMVFQQTLEDFLKSIDSNDLMNENIEAVFQSIDHLYNLLPLRQDQEALNTFRHLIQIAKKLCEEDMPPYEDQNYYYRQFETESSQLLVRVSNITTRFAIGTLKPEVENLQYFIIRHKQDWLRRIQPELTIILVDDHYAPDQDGKIELLFRVENKPGASPARKLKLMVKIIPGDEEYFRWLEPSGERSFSLSGGDHRLFAIELKLTPKAIQEGCFLIHVYCPYKTGEYPQEKRADCEIFITQPEDFNAIVNPYRVYANGGPVTNKAMFFGRDALIQYMLDAILEAKGITKNFVIYGQKRTGKSSLLYHLGRRLREYPDLLVLDLGNIGSILDPEHEIPFTTLFMQSILQHLSYALRDRYNQGACHLDFEIPDYYTFFQSPAPLMLFNMTFANFQRAVAQNSDWQKIRVVLVIDEFTYIYLYMAQGKIQETFMKNWKAFLQSSYFTAILAGQDSMPDFLTRYANEFGTSTDQKINYLEPQYARKLIEEPILNEHGQSRYDEDAIQKIFELTAGSPFYIQKFCDQLVLHMNRKKRSRITLAEVYQVAEMLIRGKNALRLNDFNNLYSNSDVTPDAVKDSDALTILTRLAHFTTPRGCARHRIADPADKKMNDVLENLVDREIVYLVEDDHYKIRVDLFKEWIVANREPEGQFIDNSD